MSAKNVDFTIPSQNEDFGGFKIVFIGDKTKRPGFVKTGGYACSIHIKTINGEMAIIVPENEMENYIPNFSEKMLCEMKIAFLQDAINEIREEMLNFD